MPFEVVANDPETGTVLDENFEWHIDGTTVLPLRRTFTHRNLAEGFATEIHSRRTDVELWIIDLETSESQLLFDGLGNQKTRG
jgi:hypothetical protein